MSCAGCDDCPSGAWHLHVTVGAVHNGFWAVGEERELVRSLGYKPVLVANIMADGSSYNELIPTANFVGTEAKATHALFEMGSQLLRVGLEVKRLKIEGSPKLAVEGRPLYFEAHMKNLKSAGVAHAQRFRSHFHLSRSKDVDIWTVRAAQFYQVMNLVAAVVPSPLHALDQRIEACVLDTAPELDNVWMGIAA